MKKGKFIQSHDTVGTSKSFLIISRANVSLRDREKFWRRYETGQNMGKILAPSALASRSKARRIAPKLSHVKN